MESNGPMGTTKPRVAAAAGRASGFALRAQREIHGGPLHRKVIAPTLQGVFHDDDGGYVSDPDWEEFLRHLPQPHFGEFVSLLGTTPPDAAPPPPPVDPSFAFLANELPDDAGGEGGIFLLDSCNGPSSAACRRTPTLGGRADLRLGIEDTHPPACTHDTHTYLVFDPAVSSHFHLLLCSDWGYARLRAVHTYSSKTGAWTNSETDWSDQDRQRPSEQWRYGDNTGISHGDSVRALPGAFLNRMLYLILGREDEIVEVGVEGKTHRIIPMPHPPYLKRLAAVL
uniref:Uncharacterized protein n=1 Tax=Setaria italica TaxID=4555 RepID=K3ZDM8_SETIT